MEHFHVEHTGGAFKERSKRGFRKDNCSKCGAILDREGQRYCKECHAEEMREYRARKAELVQKLKEFYKLHNGTTA